MKKRSTPYKILAESLITELKLFGDLDINTQHEIASYLEEMGKDPNEAEYDVGVMESKFDIEYWLNTKLSVEGEPPDKELIDQICQDGEIREPVILDVQMEVAVEGRHRLFAANRCDLSVPVVAIVY